MRRSIIIVLGVLTVSISFMGDVTVPTMNILAPFPSDSIAYDAGKVFIVSQSKESGENLTVSTQWEKLHVFDLSALGTKENFARDFYSLFEPNTTVEMLTYSFKIFKGYTKPESLTYGFLDSMNIKRLWQRPEFSQMVKRILQAKEANEVLVTMKGWNDSTYTTTYDDPTIDGRALYKLHAQLIPGVNDIYFSPAGKKKNAVEFRTTYGIEYKPATERETLFHNSSLESNCTSCHEGLPSADSGKTMTADCSVCHKAMLSASYEHAPAEMKECASCHSWSAEKHAVVVEKGVPTVCYDCHSEKQAQVDSSAFPHPVAGECLTCHSTHGTEQKHILKQSVYSLCTSCHEEEKVNHPVGRHPVRFTKLQNGDEISCTTCHDPHGTSNERMLRVGGGRMGVCVICH